MNKTKNQELKSYLKGHHFDFGLKSAKGREGITASQDPSSSRQVPLASNMISREK